MIQPEGETVVHVSSEDAFGEDGDLIVPDAPEGFVGEMKIIIHAEVIGVDGKVRTTTQQEVQ